MSLACFSRIHFTGISLVINKELNESMVIIDNIKEKQL